MQENAGDQPAASNLATQGQSRTLRHVTNCPFCSYECRGISLNVGIVPAARELYPGGVTVEIHQHPDQQLFLFGGDVASGVPCNHLVLMWGSCEWMTDDSQHLDVGGCVEFDYNSPSVMSQPNDELEIYLKERVVTRTCGKQFMPMVPVRQRQIWTKWQTPANAEHPAWTFHLRVWAYFGLDVPKLFSELDTKSKAYWQHCTAAEKARKPKQ